MKNKIIITLLAFVLFFNACSQKQAVTATDIQNIKDFIENTRIRYGVNPENVQIHDHLIMDALSSRDTMGMRKNIESFMAKMKRAQDDEIKSKEREKFYWEVVVPEVAKAKTKEQYIELAKKYPGFVEMPEN